MGNDYHSPIFVEFIKILNNGSLILGIEGIRRFIKEYKVRVLIYGTSYEYALLLSLAQSNAIPPDLVLYFKGVPMIYSWILAIRAARSMFNNGFIAMSNTHAACMNFVNTLEKIPGIIAQYEERTAKLKADVPQLEAIVAKSWGKEDELKQLKSDLAALDRKITAALAPKKEEQDGEENKQQPETQRVEVRDNHSQSNGSKESMMAEPPNHNLRETSGSHIIIGGCGINPQGGFRAAGPKL